MPIDYTDYEALTVAELKDMADQLGLDIPSDARKADIIDALKAAAPKEESKSARHGEQAGKNAYNYTMSSTVEEVPLDSEDFRKIKLLS